MNKIFWIAAVVVLILNSLHSTAQAQVVKVIKTSPPSLEIANDGSEEITVIGVGKGIDVAPHATIAFSPEPVPGHKDDVGFAIVRYTEQKDREMKAEVSVYILNLKTGDQKLIKKKMITGKIQIK